MNKTLSIVSGIIFFTIICIGGFLFYSKQSGLIKTSQISSSTNQQNQDENMNPLSIKSMQSRTYPGSDISILETLADGSNYHRHIATYKSDGLTIRALLTVPAGEKPASGWPVIVFNHGYIPPDVYRTTERYIAYTDYFSRNGYIVFKPDYRGNGESEGQPEGAYYSPAYTIDVLNAVASIKKYTEADPNRIGMWGHSMGGNIALRIAVVKPEAAKAFVIWGGVVGSYDDLMNKWQRRVPYQPPPTEAALRNRFRAQIIEKYGTPQQNPAFWNALDPVKHLALISVPIQLHHGESDEEVPLLFSRTLFSLLQQSGKQAELYTYPDDDHNISQSFALAMQRSLEFFNSHVKGGEPK